MDSLFVPLAFFGFPLALAGTGIALAWRAQAGAARRRMLLGFGVAMIVLPVAFFAMMLSGETIAELGWGRGVAMIGPWALAAVALLAVAWLRPQPALWLFRGLALVPIGFGVWSTVDAAGYAAWLDEVGPQNLIASYLLITATMVVALRRPWAAGVLIAVVAGVPALAALLVPGPGQSRAWILAALNAPALISAALLMLAGWHGFVDRPGRGGGGPADERALDPAPRPMDPAV